jgi:xylulokinase
MDLFLGIDLGTSYFKAGLFDRKGKLRGLGRGLVPKQRPVATTCELPVEAFWSTLQQTIAQALQEADAKPDQVKAMSYASQANSFVLLDQQQQTLSPLILWPDERAGEVHPDLEAFCKLQAWRVKTGMGIPLSRYSAVNKLLWYHAQPGQFKKAAKMLTISDYLTFVLTGHPIGDLSTASLLGLLDVQSNNWWPEAVACVLPNTSYVAMPQRTGTAAGTLTREGASLLGLSRDTQFYLGGLDHHIAAIGAGVTSGERLSESTGTVLAAVKYTDQYLPMETVCVAPGLDVDHYFNMTFDNNGAGFLEWYQQTKAPQYTIQQLLQQAAAIAPGSEGLQALLQEQAGETLYSFEGTGNQHQHGHYVRAILESTAWQLASLLQKLDGDARTSVVSTGGGARSTLWTSIKASVTGRPFLVPACSEAACLGAALLAATGNGLFENPAAAVAQWVQYQAEIVPDEREIAAYKELAVSY